MADYTGTTDENGKLTMKKVPVGEYDVTATKEGYADYNGEVTVDKDIDLNIKLNKTRAINFTVNYKMGDSEPTPLENALVIIGDETRTTGSAGGCSFPSIADGEHTVHVATKDEGGANATINVSEDSTSFEILVDVGTGNDMGEVYLTYSNGDYSVKKGLLVCNGIYGVVNEDNVVTFFNVKQDEPEAVYELEYIGNDEFYGKKFTATGSELQGNKEVDLDFYGTEVTLKITDTENTPISSAEISIYNNDYNVDASTDENGLAVFKVKYGEGYNCEIYKAEYEPLNLTGLEFTEPTQNLEYQLEVEPQG